VAGTVLEQGGEDPSEARTTTHQIWIEGGEVEANIYDRGELRAGNVVRGPAIVTEMDSTTLVLPGHAATVHPSGSLLIRPLDSNPEN
jgi:N-methylhydantoinase A